MERFEADLQENRIKIIQNSNIVLDKKVVHDTSLLSQYVQTQ